MALAGKYPHVYAAIGVHPDEVGELNEDKIQHMKELCCNKKVVAVGEIGLDYYWDNEPHEVQQKWFIRQLELAGEVKKPVIIHSREAAADTMYIMKNYAQGLDGVIHCYSYSREMAEEYVKMGQLRFRSRRSCWRQTARIWHRSRTVANGISLLISGMWLRKLQS